MGHQPSAPQTTHAVIKQRETSSNYSINILVTGLIKTKPRNSITKHSKEKQESYRDRLMTHPILAELFGTGISELGPSDRGPVLQQQLNSH